MKPVQISYGASWSYLDAPEGEYPGLIPCIRGGLAVYVETAIFSPLFIEGRWDGLIHFMSEGGRFASGLLDQVCAICQNVGYEPVIKGRPNFSGGPLKPPRLKTLPLLREESPWWFQWPATRAILQKGRGVLRIPTGGGKTVVAALLIQSLPSDRVLFLVDQIELLDQTAERFEVLLGEPVGRLGGGEHTVDLSRRVCISTVQTLAEKKDRKTRAVLTPLWTKNKGLPREWLSGVSLLILDECHNSTSDSYYEVTQAFSQTHRRVGLSATPFRRGELNTAKLIACCGEEVYTIPTKTLIDLGILANPNIYMLQYGEISDSQFETNTRQFGYDEAYDAFICRNRLRNEALLRVLRGRDKVLVIVSKKKKHGELLHNLLSEAFPDKVVSYVSGDTARGERRANRLKFLQGNVDILIATSIYDKGVDLPNVETLVLAGGGKSEVNIIQRLGRGMRGTSKKNTVTVFDFLDMECSHLVEHSLARYDTYTTEGYNVIVASPDQVPA
jgi:superfamily II DNA or RNA helicase